MKKILYLLLLLSANVSAQTSLNRWINYPAAKDRGLVVSEEFYQPAKASPPVLSGANNAPGYSFLNTQTGDYYISNGTGSWNIYPSQNWLQTQFSGVVHKSGEEVIDGVKNFTGSVGIGTSNTGIYQLAVNGKIRAREIKIDPNGWADYVFDESYAPRSLNDIEKFVKQHKHLPEVPTAKEVAAEGINLGEMNILLLKKIEELTLYIINQEKRIKLLEDKAGAK